jgi:uncharacterized protein YoxC
VTTLHTLSISTIVILVLFFVVVIYLRGRKSSRQHLLQTKVETKGTSSTFGQCRFNSIDAYDCSLIIATPHSDSTKMASHVWLYGEAPTTLQEKAFEDLVARYDQLWPNVASKLATLHPELDSVEDIRRCVRNRVAVHVGEHAEDSIELVYEFDLPNEGSRGFFLRVDGIQVIDGFMAE